MTIVDHNRQMKICRECKIEKPLTDYFKEKRNADGHNNFCKVCKTLKTIQWRVKNKDSYNAKMRAYNKKNYGHLRLYRYKLTKLQFKEIQDKQNNKCAICLEPPKGKRPLAIDHNHKTGQVRGLLCYGCNRALHVLENDNLFEKAQNYLKLFSKEL